MKITYCSSCKQKNEIDYVLLFDNTFEWFVCSKCDDVWVKSQYGDWIESNPYQEYIKKLKPGNFGKKITSCYILNYFTQFLH